MAEAGGYAGYDVLAKWDTPSFDPITRRVLANRMHAVPGRTFLPPELYLVLEAVCARIVPQPERAEPIPIAPWVDAELASQSGGGYRRPEMPPAREAWATGLGGIEAEALARYRQPFTALDSDSQDVVLQAIQDGEANPVNFPGLPAATFFLHVLAKTVAGVYYAHPEAWSEIGFGGPASPRGYVRTGLNERDPWEAPLIPARGDGL